MSLNHAFNFHFKVGPSLCVSVSVSSAVSSSAAAALYTLEVRTRSFSLITPAFHHAPADIFKTCILSASRSSPARGRRCYSGFSSTTQTAVLTCRPPSPPAMLSIHQCLCAQMVPHCSPHLDAGAIRINHAVLRPRSV